MTEALIRIAMFVSFTPLGALMVGVIWALVLLFFGLDPHGALFWYIVSAIVAPFLVADVFLAVFRLRAHVTAWEMAGRVANALTERSNTPSGAR